MVAKGTLLGDPDAVLTTVVHRISYLDIREVPEQQDREILTARPFRRNTRAVQLSEPSAVVTDPLSTVAVEGPCELNVLTLKRLDDAVA